MIDQKHVLTPVPTLEFIRRNEDPVVGPVGISDRPAQGIALRDGFGRDAAGLIGIAFVAVRLGEDQSLVLESDHDGKGQAG